MPPMNAKTKRVIELTALMCTATKNCNRTEVYRREDAEEKDAMNRLEPDAEKPVKECPIQCEHAQHGLAQGEAHEKQVAVVAQRCSDSEKNREHTPARERRNVQQNFGHRVPDFGGDPVLQQMLAPARNRRERARW